MRQRERKGNGLFMTTRNDGQQYEISDGVMEHVQVSKLNSKRMRAFCAAVAYACALA